MLIKTPRVTYASLLLLREIGAYIAEHRRFPRASELGGGKSTMRGAVQRNLTVLATAGYISRRSTHWHESQLSDAGNLWLAGSTEMPAIERPITVQLTRKNKIRVSPKKRRTLTFIGRHVEQHGSFPTPHQIVQELEGRVSSWGRAHMISLLRTLELDGYLARDGSSLRTRWKSAGRLTEKGLELIGRLPKQQEQSTFKLRKHVGGGIHQDGGTRHKNLLMPADRLGKELIQLSDKYSKLGYRVKKSTGSGRQKGKRIATFSLEEGRTCSPNCGLLEVCYAGKMSRQKRILYEGKKTDRLVAKAIAEAGPLHYRINTVGDIPTQPFLEGVFVAVAVTGSTAFGYTHWQPEHPLGALIRQLSDWHWEFFSFRTSYEHGSREPLLERGAVTMESFDPKLLAEHNAIPCPEQTGQAKSCAECGMCWTTRRNVAFKLH